MIIITRVVATCRPILVVGYKSNFVKVHQGRADQQNNSCLIMGAIIAEVQASGMMPSFQTVYAMGPCA